VDKFQKIRNSDPVFQGNDYFDSEKNQDSDIINVPESEEKADRALRKLKNSQGGKNVVNSGS
jgi:hypothetical protein